MIVLWFFLNAAYFGSPIAPMTQQPMSTRQSNTALSAADSLVDNRSFMRRIWLDLAGRLPSRERVEAFLSRNDVDKRSQEIDFLLSTDMFTDRWTTFMEDLFQSFAIFEDHAVYRNAFHHHLRKMVAQNVAWDEMARRIITGRGTGETPETSMFFWAKESFEETFRPDYLDDQAAWITDTMLGVQTLCISCHDGAGHLEQVNVDLTAKTRRQFWGMAAFLASTYIYENFEFDEDGLEEVEAERLFFGKLEMVDLDQPGFQARRQSLLPTFAGAELAINGPNQYDGSYHADSRPGQGMRPPRSGGVIQPTYMFSGEGQKADETKRQALARLLTADRQFARNMVNRIWAHLFGNGFVEPHNAWDLARLDETAARTNGTTVQPRNGFLLEFLTDWFIDNGHDMRGLLRLMANSKLYQWDYASHEKGQGAIDDNDRWGAWRDNSRVRRIEAEAVVDSLNQVLGLQPKYVITGELDRTRTSAWQLPDPSEPSDAALFWLLGGDEDGELNLNTDLSHLGVNSLEELYFYTISAQEILSGFGRGDYFTGTARNNDNSIQNGLLLFNAFPANFWLEDSSFTPTVVQLKTALDTGQLSKPQLVKRLFEDVLFRSPSADEERVIMSHIQNLSSERSVVDTLWMVLNHPDFIYK